MPTTSGDEHVRPEQRIFKVKEGTVSIPAHSITFININFRNKLEYVKQDNGIEVHSWISVFSRARTLLCVNNFVSKYYGEKLQYAKAKFYMGDNPTFIYILLSKDTIFL